MIDKRRVEEETITMTKSKKIDKSLKRFKHFKLCRYHAEVLSWDACSDGFVGCQVAAARKRELAEKIEDLSHQITDMERDKNATWHDQQARAWVVTCRLCHALGMQHNTLESGVRSVHNFIKRLARS